jgi:hypothetical protein
MIWKTHPYPVRIPRHVGWKSYHKLHFLTEKAGDKALSFLTGLTQIALTRPDSTHLPSMELMLFD